MKETPLFLPLRVGRYNLRNRIVMAPLTRRRATNDLIPTDIMRIYYGQRATAGLIIAEATNISWQAVGYPNSPGIFTTPQIEAWKPITAEVHEKQGLIFLQLWHVGRVSHPDIQPNRQLPVSSSAVKAGGTITTPGGTKEMVVPRALETFEIPQLVEDYVKAAENAIEAGFDGIEIHGANGYLPEQFLHDGSNIRNDKYGGSIQNRCRFMLEIIKNCCSAVGSDRVGLRLSPSGVVKDMFDSDPVSLYEYLISELDRFNLAYLHLMEPYAPLIPEERYRHYLKQVTPHFRKFYSGPMITNVNYNFASANEVIRTGHADMVAFGKPFISNPDLVERFRKNLPLTDWDKSTFYHGGEKGYIDYPFYNSR
ncbi:MAG: alkene reductase [Bacteroidales bacterium]|nr:alkene reductase [Bacteroidales bacterium]